MSEVQDQNLNSDHLDLKHLDKKTAKLLIEKAFEAQKFCYTPYSNFNVGAALLGANGKIYQGCNIENAAYTPTNCAERTAVFKAVSEGEREFRAIAVCGDAEEYLAPCGVCRQVLLEFTEPEKFVVLMAAKSGEYRKMTLAELLPASFSKSDLSAASDGKN